MDLRRDTLFSVTSKPLVIYIKNCYSSPHESNCVTDVDQKKVNSQWTRRRNLPLVYRGSYSRGIS